MDASFCNLPLCRICSSVMPSVDNNRPLKVFPSTGFRQAQPASSGPRLCHAHADRDPVRGLPEGTRLTTPALAGGAREDGVDRYAWLDKAKLLPGQDWELEIRKAVRSILLVE